MHRLLIGVFPFTGLTWISGNYHVLQLCINKVFAFPHFISFTKCAKVLLLLSTEYWPGFVLWRLGAVFELAETFWRTQGRGSLAVLLFRWRGLFPFHSKPNIKYVQLHLLHRKLSFPFRLRVLFKSSSSPSSPSSPFAAQSLARRMSSFTGRPRCHFPESVHSRTLNNRNQKKYEEAYRR